MTEEEILENSYKNVSPKLLSFDLAISKVKTFWPQHIEFIQGFTDNVHFFNI